MAADPIAEHGALFTLDGDPAVGATVVPTPLARGPWSADALHGGAVGSLLATLGEAHDADRVPFVARVTVELMSPVPLAPMRVEVTTLRPGRVVEWVGARLFDGSDRQVAWATILRISGGTVDTSGSASPAVPAPPPPPAGDPDFPFGGGVTGFWDANDVRLVRGSWLEAGPGAAWFRLRCPVVAGMPLTPVARVAAHADFGSGVGNAVRLTNAAAINAELTVHLHRHPQGEWVCVESGGWAEPNGVGLTATVLHDERGQIGRAAQSMLVRPATTLTMHTASDAAADAGRAEA
ncbi:MAG: thioesterase family protein [Actinomycetota bacterium]